MICISSSRLSDSRSSTTQDAPSCLSNPGFSALRLLTPKSLINYLKGFRFYQQLIREVDQELEATLRQLPRAEGAPEQMPPRTKKCFYQRAGNEPAFDLKAELFRISGVDLTDVPGISAITAHTILTEVGPDLSRFRNASAFASWLGVCPDNKVSGGKVLYAGSRKVKNRIAMALRLGAQCLYHAKNYLGEYYRKMKWRLGAPQALT